jgi:hypothetical protein
VSNRPTRPCTICGVPARAQGLCGMHYQRMQRGQPVDDAGWAEWRAGQQRSKWVLSHERDVLHAYAEHGKPRPCGPVLGVSQHDWAAARPDNVAPFGCPSCGGYWHVRRHYESHRCGQGEA